MQIVHFTPYCFTRQPIVWHANGLTAVYELHVCIHVILAATHLVTSSPSLLDPNSQSSTPWQ